MARMRDAGEKAMARKRRRGNTDYADVASELGIAKASLHYHFRGKAELGEAFIGRRVLRPERSLAHQGAREGPAEAHIPPRRIVGRGGAGDHERPRGSMLVARPYGDVGRVEAAARA